MKKLSLKFGEGGPKAFLLRHVEKIVLGIAVLLVAGFFVMGYNVDSIPDDQSPKSLRTLADSAKSTIDRDSWEAIAKEREPPSDHLMRADASRLLTSSSDYPIAMPWDPQKFRRQTKRADPELYAPQNLEVGTDMVGMLFIKNNVDESNPLDNLSPPESKSDGKSSSKGDKKTTGGPAGMGMPGGMSMPSSMGSGMGMPGGMSSGGMLGGGAAGGKSGKSGGKKGDEEEETSSGGMMGMPGMMGLSGGGAGQANMVPAKYQAEIEGFRGGNTQTGVVKSVNLVWVSAVVPWKKQFAEFERKLAESVSYNPERDVPTYIYFEAERAEVSADASAPLEWTSVMHTDYAGQLMRTWAGTIPEVVDQYFISPSLTTPIPPVMMYNAEKIGMHSLVTKARMRPAVAAETEESLDAAPASTGPGKAGAGLGAGAGAKGMGGAGMGAGMTGGGMGSGMMGAGMAGGAGMTGSGMMGAGMAGGAGMMGSGMMGAGMSGGAGMMGSGMMGAGMSGGAGMMGSGMMGGAGMMGSGMGGGANAAVAPPVDFKLVRFYDMTAEPGKSYVYRVRVWLNDPNFIDSSARPSAAAESGDGAAGLAGGAAGLGMGGGMAGGMGGAGGGMTRALTLSSLQDDVVARLKKQQADDAAASSGSESAVSTYWRTTEWSEPSKAVKIPLRAQEMLAGEVTAETASQLAQGENKFMVWGEPTGKFLPVVWDDKLAVRVPLEQTVYRGSVLNEKTSVEIAHPVDLGFREVKDYEFKSDAVVVDIRGGYKLPKSKLKKDDEELRSPGEFLIVTWDGQLEATDELADLDAYRKTLFTDDSPQTPGASTPGMPGMSDMDSMMPGMPGMNSEKGKGKKGKGKQSGMPGMPGGMSSGMPGGGGMSMPPGMGGGGSRRPGSR